MDFLTPSPMERFILRAFLFLLIVLLFMFMLCLAFWIIELITGKPIRLTGNDKPQTCICKCCNKQANNQKKDEQETRHFTPIPVVIPKPLSIPHP